VEHDAQLALNVATAALNAVQKKDAADPALGAAVSAAVSAIPSPWTPVLASLIPAAIPLLVSVVQSVKLGRAMFPRVYFYEWNPYLFGSVAAGCDLALVPVDLTTPLTAGKPENKLLLFWRLGVPAIVSATDAHRRVMAEVGLEEMAAGSPADWRRALERYGPDAPAREWAAERGLRYVHEQHSEGQLLARWDRVFASVLG